MGFLGGLTSAASSITSALGLTSQQQNFINQENQMEDQQMQFSLSQQQQQNSFNDAEQIASQGAQESAQLQSFAQQIENARNTLSSNDLQQIK